MTITVEKLSRFFGEIQAVKGIVLSIERGETFGFLGPNGAGKSTTIKMLCTLLHPTSGRAWINGYDIEREASQVRQSIGIVFQDPTLDEYLTAEQNLYYHCMIYHTPRKTRDTRIRDVLQLVGLDERRKDIVKTFSGGMKRRLEVARGLLHEPERAATMLEQHTGHPVRREGDAIYVEGENGQALAANLIRQLTLADIDVLGVNVTAPTLEDVFVHLTGRVIRDESASAKDRMGSRLRSRGRLRR